MKKKEKIMLYYEDKIKSGHTEHEMLGWESERAQKARFDALYDNVMLKGKSLLDVGCGLGSLYGYLSDKGCSVKYTGVDILDIMIEKAKEIYSDAVDTEFICKDIFKEQVFDEKQFDIVYASGMFNLQLDNNIEFLSQAVLRFSMIAKSHIVFSLLHADSPDKEALYCYYRPSDVLDMLKPLTYSREWGVDIIEGYLKNDFTVIMIALQ